MIKGSGYTQEVANFLSDESNPLSGLIKKSGYPHPYILPQINDELYAKIGSLEGDKKRLSLNALAVIREFYLRELNPTKVESREKMEVIYRTLENYNALFDHFKYKDSYGRGDWVIAVLKFFVEFKDIVPGDYSKKIANINEEKYMPAAGYLIQYIDSDSLSTSFKHEAVKQSQNALEFIKNPSEPLQFEAVKAHWIAIEYVENPSPRIQMNAVKQNPYALRCIADPLLEVRSEVLKNSPWMIIELDQKPTKKEKFQAVGRLVKQRIGLLPNKDGFRRKKDLITGMLQEVKQVIQK